MSIVQKVIEEQKNKEREIEENKDKYAKRLWEYVHSYNLENVPYRDMETEIIHAKVEFEITEVVSEYSRYSASRRQYYTKTNSEKRVFPVVDENSLSEGVTLTPPDYKKDIYEYIGFFPETEDDFLIYKEIVDAVQKINEALLNFRFKQLEVRLTGSQINEMKKINEEDARHWAGKTIQTFYMKK